MISLITHFTTDELAIDDLLVLIQIDDEGRVCIPIYSNDEAEWARDQDDLVSPLAVIELSTSDARRFADALMHAADHVEEEDREPAERATT